MRTSNDYAYETEDAGKDAHNFGTDEDSDGDANDDDYDNKIDTNTTTTTTTMNNNNNRSHIDSTFVVVLCNIKRKSNMCSDLSDSRQIIPLIFLIPLFVLISSAAEVCFNCCNLTF